MSQARRSTPNDSVNLSNLDPVKLESSRISGLSLIIAKPPRTFDISFS